MHYYIKKNARKTKDFTFMRNRPTVREMLEEAIEKLGGNASYTAIRDYITNTYGDVKKSTINAHITSCTVNNPSRVHYTSNQKPRIANSKYDLLFRIDRGRVERYNQEQHGIWEIKEDEHGVLTISRGITDDGKIEKEDSFPDTEEGEEELLFPMENHLRDFLVKNLSTIKINGKQLQLYVDENGRDGTEYPTREVGTIDILAINEDENFIVFELKLTRGPDRALGQLQRYMGWVKENLAGMQNVHGVIVANKISKTLKYAASVTSNISLFEYQIDFKIHSVKVSNAS